MNNPDYSAYDLKSMCEVLALLRNKELRVVPENSVEPSIFHEMQIIRILLNAIAIRDRLEKCISNMPRHRYDHEVLHYILAGKEIPRYDRY